MLNVPELEQRWKRYRRRKKMPLYTTFISIVTLVGTGAALFYFLPDILSSHESPAQTTPKDANTSAVGTIPPKEMRVSAHAASSASVAVQNDIKKRPATSHPAKTVNVSTPQNKTSVVPVKKLVSGTTSEKRVQPKTKLQPSMDFMEDFESDVMDYYFQGKSKTEVQQSTMQEVPSVTTTPSETDDTLPSLNTEMAQKPAKMPSTQVHQPTPQTAEAIKPKPTHNKQPMLIQRESDMKDIQDVIARFKKNKNPALSLFIAKRYYAIGNYQQAYNYALITNELDRNIEDSWLIFAKSLYKLDQKDMALKTLKTYQNDSGSVKAKITIEQMESGTFK